MGSTEAMLAAAAPLAEIYKNLAKLIGIPEHRIALSGSNTDAWQKPFLALDLQPGDRILVGESEWGGNLSVLKHRCELHRATLEVIPSTDTGVIDVDAFAAMLDRKVRMVCVTWVSAVCGAVNPVAQMASTLKNHSAWFFVDAAQSFGQISTDLSNSRFDVVTVSPRKYLRGPRGLGFTGYSERFLESVLPRGIDQFSGPWGEDGIGIRNDARKFEYGESSYIVRIGFAEAVKLALGTDWPAIQSTIADLAAHIRKELNNLPGITVHERGEGSSGITTFSHNTVLPSTIKEHLSKLKINIATPAQTYAPLWFASGRPLISRISPHAFNTHTEVEQTLQAINDVVIKKQNQHRSTSI